ncbi:MAG TPA: transporter substrate-binding domain-containing protein [Cellvibrio sp.]|nr:transporter substrate-binding domain-containing protein [Cellvibrio sp.]
MKSTAVIFLLLIAIHSAMATTPEREITLGTNVSSAYTAERNQLVRGGSIEHIECIFKDLQQPYQITSMPWLRARQEVRKGKIDGFFTAISIDEADSYASLSAPLVLENWYWFWRADMKAPESWRDNYKLGAILGSQQAEWLEEAGYPEPMDANNLPQMLKMLFSKRIDVILADKEHFEKAAAELGIDTNSYQYRFFRYVPLGVYFGKAFLAEHPGFLPHFNQHIYACAPEGFQMSGYERKKVKNLVMPLMQQWTALPEVITAVMAQNDNQQTARQQAILEKDALWQSEFKAGNFSLSASLMSIPLSQQLRQFKTRSQGLITEIILMDGRGASVAISDMTSDYWQGDEAKFLLSFNKSPEMLFFEPVGYDESTRRFQVHVSLPIYAPDIEASIGVLTVGVDIEKALSLQQ